MAYKEILVHLDNSSRGDVRLDFAVELAGRHESYLTGLYPVEIPSPSLYMGDASIFDLGLADEIMSRARQRAIELAAAVEQRFREMLRQRGMSGEWRRLEAPPAEVVAEHGRCADLVIVGQTDPDHPKHSFGTQIPVAAILQSGRPVLVIPYVGTVKTVGKKVLVGWKSGRESARAVHDALPLLAGASDVTVLAIDPDSDVDGINEPAAAITRHLVRHGVPATAKHTVFGDIPEGDVLLNYASEHGADLIVVGGYGHSRASEFMLGGVTRTLLTEMTVPVLFSH
jgi:nucleotide-binding universal stress UspA family protein